MNLPLLTVPVWAALAVVAVTLIAADTDYRSRRIPNLLTLPALLAALAIHAIAGGAHGVGQAALGALVAGGILLPGWLLGWMGAGDVKLMSAVGAWLAWPASLTASLAALIAGGVIALVVAIRHRALGRSLRGAASIGIWALLLPGRKAPPPAASSLRFPFAAAILAGSIISLWVRI
jgi:prepilin peptidase CpaA